MHGGSQILRATLNTVDAQKGRRGLFFTEAVQFSWQALRASPVRSLLTALGMVIGTASVILVVTISLTSRDYILEQIQGIGSNIIFAYYANAGGSTVSEADYIKMPD